MPKLQAQSSRQRTKYAIIMTSLLRSLNRSPCNSDCILTLKSLGIQLSILDLDQQYSMTDSPTGVKRLKIGIPSLGRIADRASIGAI